jgi:putative peptidoglycan lipid II flippase
LRLHAGASATLRPLVVAGIVTVGGQQLCNGLAISLASAGRPGSIVIYNLAQTIFLVPWAVLALPLATTTYPALAEAGAVGDDEQYARTLAPAARSVLLLCCLGTAALVALAKPMAVLLAQLTAHRADADQLTAGIAGFAPGLIGYGLFALFSRALYARAQAYAAAVVTGIGWASAIVAALVLANALPVYNRVGAVALATAIGMTVLGGGLAFVVRLKAGPPSVHGFARTLISGVSGAGLAIAAAFGVRTLVWDGTPGWAAALAQGMLCGVVVAVVFAGVAAVTDRHTLQPLLRRLKR